MKKILLSVLLLLFSITLSTAQENKKIKKVKYENHGKGKAKGHYKEGKKGNDNGDLKAKKEEGQQIISESEDRKEIIKPNKIKAKEEEILYKEASESAEEKLKRTEIRAEMIQTESDLTPDPIELERKEIEIRKREEERSNHVREQEQAMKEQAESESREAKKPKLKTEKSPKGNKKAKK